jgi:hypothetical protein
MAPPRSAGFTPINKPHNVDDNPDSMKECQVSKPKSSKRSRTMPDLVAPAKKPKKLMTNAICPRSMRDYRDSSENDRLATTDSGPVIKGLDNSHIKGIKTASSLPRRKHISTNNSVAAGRTSDSFNYGFHDPSEVQKPLVTSTTSLDVLRSSPTHGCSIYDTRAKDPKPVESPDFGHKIRRVASRPLSPGSMLTLSRRNRLQPNRVALVSDLEGINEALDAEQGLNSSPNLISPGLFADNMDQVSNRHDSDTGNASTDHLKKSGPSITSFKDQHSRVSNGTDFPESDDDECFMVDEIDLSELETLTRRVESQVGVAKQKAEGTANMSIQGASRTTKHQAVVTKQHIDTYDSAVRPNIELPISTPQPLSRLSSSTLDNSPAPSFSSSDFILRKPFSKTALFNKKPPDAKASTPPSISRLSSSTIGNSPVPVFRPPKPIVRKPFPEQVEAHSPVIGVTADTVLRTCFRIGEAIYSGNRSSGPDRLVALELYARVKSSWREDGIAKQHFVFQDLYHDKPPFMDSVHETWEGVPVWDQECARFIGPEAVGSMCRVVGDMRRKGDSKLEIVVKSIRKTTWAEVEYIAGIYS